MRRHRTRSTGPICRIDVSAFASVLVALVFAVMIASVMTGDLPRVVADLPQASHPSRMPKALAEDAAIVAVLRDGHIYFGDEQITSDQLPEKIRASIRQGAERKVYIRADAGARYRAVQEVLESVQAAGVENVGFLVEPRKPSCSGC